MISGRKSRFPELVPCSIKTRLRKTSPQLRKGLSVRLFVDLPKPAGATSFRVTSEMMKKSPAPKLTFACAYTMPPTPD